MSRQTWTKRDPIKNYFPLPNEIYSLGLHLASDIGEAAALLSPAVPAASEP